MQSTEFSSATAFQTGSILHFASLLIGAVIVILFGIAGRRAVARGEETARLRLRAVAGYGCLVVWLINTTFWCLPGLFAWEQSLPLQFCNLANLIGAAAVLGSSRYWKAILYFWSIVLCVWAFLTPVLSGGYATAEFWVFWGYHLFIPLSLAEVLVIQRYRPSAVDLRNAWVFTVGYLVLLTVLDNFFGWNYGFVGPSVPANPTLIDVLGPYPLRLLWMLLIGTALFVLAWLPWRGPKKEGT